MIFLLDDKKIRQKDFGWTEEKFAQYVSHIKPLYTIDDVVKIGENLYDAGNIILYHESFLDFTDDSDKALKQRNKIAKMAEANNRLSVAFFSGSQSSRSLNTNIAYLPVANLYQNLEVLIQHHNKDNSNLKYLLFGENPEIEEELYKILTLANRDIEADSAIIPGKNIFIRTFSNSIQNAIKEAIEEKIFNDVSDEKLSEKVNEWLSETEYDNIFIPLCFGQTLSDFNGLRLATHIRCTFTINQLKRIFIYSFVGIEYLLQNEYFNILKTKNISLIPYSKKAFQEYAKNFYNPLTIEELPAEIAKIKLGIPKNYEDNHSIANEWGVYQLAYNAGIEINEISDFDKEKLNSLYFKWLIVKNGLQEPLTQTEKNENEDFRKQINVRIVGQIDISKIPKR